MTGETEMRQDSPQPSPVTVEVAITVGLGHDAGAWLRTCAQRTADRGEATALLRLGCHETDTLELLTPTRNSVEPKTSPGLSAAIASSASVAEKWLIEPAALTPWREILEAAPDLITFFAGGERRTEHSVCNGIRELVKTGRELDIDVPSINLVAVAADLEKAERIRQAVAEATSLQVELRECLEKVSPTSGVISQFVDDPAPTVWSVVREIREASVTARAARVARAVLEHAELPPEPAVRKESGSRIFSNEPSSLVDCVGPLTLVCKRDNDVEVAVDPIGRLHVLAFEAQLRELHIEATWAQRERKLIAQAHPAHKIDLTAHLALHLFTEDPVSVADLYDTSWGLHLLTPARLGDRHYWYYAPLNAPARVDKATCRL